MWTRFVKIRHSIKVICLKEREWVSAFEKLNLVVCMKGLTWRP